MLCGVLFGIPLWVEDVLKVIVAGYQFRVRIVPDVLPLKQSQIESSKVRELIF